MEEEKKTILGCMSDVVEAIKGREKTSSRGSKKANMDVATFYRNLYDEMSGQIDYIAGMCGITPRQSVILSCCIEMCSRHNFDKDDLADFLGISSIKMLTFDEDFRALHQKKLILLQKNSSIHIQRHVIPALSSNKPYEIPYPNGLDSPAIFSEMKYIISNRIQDDIDQDDMLMELDQLISGNPEAGFVKTCSAYNILGPHGVNWMERIVFYNLVYRYLYEDDDKVGWHDYSDVFEDDREMFVLKSKYRRECLELQKRGIIGPVFADGMADGELFHIKDEIKEELFEEVGGLRKEQPHRGRMKLLPPENIQSKEMFYNRAENEQIERLSSLLREENYQATVKRLKESGLRTGFCCLFYGAPGTGKTETAYQLAKQTGRAIVPVSVADVKSCWVGETEKMMKGIFQKYRRMANDSDLMPILLFNECDQLFGIRREAATSAVDKMENSVQNIILEEMENFSGIMLASTNLTENLDPAFSRRFIFKVKFEKPSREAKGKIWKSNFPTLTESQTDELASSFDFSGGQIENVSRKKVIQTIIEGSEPDFEQIKAFCREEPIDDRRNGMKKIGY